jgi:hypothetical protein
MCYGRRRIPGEALRAKTTPAGPLGPPIGRRSGGGALRAKTAPRGLRSSSRSRAAWRRCRRQCPGDNGLDACEEAGIAPEITIAVATTKLTISATAITSSSSPPAKSIAYVPFTRNSGHDTVTESQLKGSTDSTHYLERLEHKALADGAPLMRRSSGALRNPPVADGRG